VAIKVEEKNKSRNKKKKAVILLCVGFAIILFCALLFFSSSNIWEPEGIPMFIFISIGVAVGVPLIVTGLIMLFVAKFGGVSATAVASLVFGLCGIPTAIYLSYYCCFFGLIGTVLGLIALVTSMKNSSPAGRIVAVTGLVLGIGVFIAPWIEEAIWFSRY
jgi:hypothetical protein